MKMKDNDDLNTNSNRSARRTLYYLQRTLSIKMTSQRRFILLLPIILVAEAFYISSPPATATKARSLTQIHLFGGGGGKIPSSPAERCVAIVDLHLLEGRIFQMWQ